MNESQKDFKLIFFCAAIMFIYRTVLIMSFSAYFTEPLNGIDYLLALLVGFRYDISVGAYVAVLPFLFSTACLFRPIPHICKYIRLSMLIFFSMLSSMIILANYLFFLEYKDNFNQWVFGVIYDDFSAVLSTIWKSDPVFSLSCILSGSTLICIFMGFYVVKRPFYTILHKGSERRLTTKIACVFTIIIFFFCAVRGSICTRPVQLKDAGVTRDSMLNKMILNPYYALRYVLKQYIKLSHADGIDLYIQDNDIQGAANRCFGKTISGRSLDNYMKKSARGINLKKPRHVFLIVMESFDAWPLFNEYKSFDVMPFTRQLGQKGILLTHFLSSGTGTMTSLSSIITGLPDVGVITNYQPSARKPFPTSLAFQLKRLGFECHMYYGGYLSWQRIGDFCKDQGFDHIDGGGHMDSWALKEWGVDDKQMFDYIYDQFKPSTSSFNLILSTSNHPPYDIPVYEMGFPIKKIPEDLKHIYDGRWSLKVFGHLWYSDKVLGEFIERISQKAPDSLFFVTGDHWSRKFLNPRPNLLIQSTVPLLIYSKQGFPLSMKPSLIAASHLNILPTMIECIAPKGFEYYSICQDIFNKKRLPIGIGRKSLITPCQIWDIFGNHFTFSLNCESTMFNYEQVKRHINDMYGIGWWRIVRGSNF
jgi:phosphoglycerol transferase MdoB-like AlkP superfamily enzyme